MTIRTKPASDAYAEGWERTFGEPRRRREAADRKFRREMAKAVADEVARPNLFLNLIRKGSR